MAARTQVELELIALTKQANADMKKFAADSQKQLSGISMAGVFTAISTGYLAVADVASRVTGVMVEGFTKAIAEATEAEEAAIRLANAMRLAGDYSEQSFNSFQKLASEIQRTTTNSDDAATAAIALAKSYGLSNREAEQVLIVATDLSAMLGEDLTASTQRLARQLNGTRDRELEKFIKGLKGLSEQQLITGQGLDMVAQKVQGTAAALTNSFSGALTQAKNEFSEIFEELGKAIISTPELTRAIKSLGAMFGVLAANIAGAAPAISKVVGALLRFSADAAVVFLTVEKYGAKYIASIVAGYQYVYGVLGQFRELIVGFFEFVVTSTEKGTKRIQGVFDNFGKTANPKRFLEQLTANQGAVDAAFDPLINAAKKFRADLDKVEAEAAKKSLKYKGLGQDDAAAARLAVAERARILQEWNSQRKSIEEAGLSDVEKITREYAMKEKLVRDAFRFGYIANEEQKNKYLQQLDEERLKKLEAANKAQLEKLTAENAKFAGDTFNALAEAYQKGTKLSKDQAIAAGAGIVSNVLKGAEGARQALGAIAGAVANYFIPGIGPVVNEIVQALSKGPDYVVKMVREFREALPGLVENILTSIPALIESIIEDTPRIIEKIVQMIPRVIDAFIKAIPRIIIAFAKSMPEVAKTFMKEMVKAIPEIVKGLAEGLWEAAKQLGQFIIDEIKSLGGLLGGGSGGGGLGGIVDGAGNGIGNFFGDVFGGIGDFFGFAEGGRVPDNAAFRGDRFPARLDAGEQVFSRDLTSRLERYLDGQGAGQPVVLQLVMNERVLAEQVYHINRKGYRTAPV